MGEDQGQGDTDVIATVRASEVNWHMEAWSSGSKDYPASDHFEAEPALAALLANDVVFLNSHWWEEEWPEAAKRMASLSVCCNDVFAWGCADAEQMPYAEIENVYENWRKDAIWGPAIWCMIQRKELPQKPVADRIKQSGIWDRGVYPMTAASRALYRRSRRSPAVRQFVSDYEVEPTTSPQGGEVRQTDPLPRASDTRTPARPDHGGRG